MDKGQAWWYLTGSLAQELRLDWQTALTEGTIILSRAVVMTTMLECSAQHVSFTIIVLEGLSQDALE